MRAMWRTGRSCLTCKFCGRRCRRSSEARARTEPPQRRHHAVASAWPGPLPVRTSIGAQVVFPADDGLARDLAFAAGERLLKLRTGGQDADELKRAGDLGSQDLLAGQACQLGT